MVGLVLLAALSAAPGSKVALVPFKLSQVSPELAGYAEDRLASELAKRGVQVTTPSEVQALLGFERQRQLLGCSDEASSCMAELSAALGLELVLVGRLTRLGERFEADVKVIRQQDASVAARSIQAVDGEQRLGALLEDTAAEIAKQLQPPEAGRPFNWRLWGPVIAGSVVAAVGAVGWIEAEVRHTSYITIDSPAPLLTADRVGPTIQQLNIQRVLSIVGTGAGAALIAAGIVWNSLTPVVVPTATGVTVSVHGTLW